MRGHEQASQPQGDLVPFRYVDHPDGFPKGGYIHPAGMNRAERRELWKTLSSRKGRMTVRKLKERKGGA